MRTSEDAKNNKKVDVEAEERGYIRASARISLDLLALIVQGKHAPLCGRGRERAISTNGGSFAGGRTSLGPMDHKGVHIIQLQVLEGSHEIRLHMLLAMVGIPQLGLNEKILALDYSRLKKLFQNLALRV